MTTCTIIISHYESLQFLYCCLRQIGKCRNSNIKHSILVIDQSKTPVNFIFQPEWFDKEDEITVVHTEPYYSGYGIDWAIRNVDIKTDYICQLHVDAFPIHKNWLSLSITLLEEYGLAFVGQHQFVSKSTDTIYPNKIPFFAMSQCFNVARTFTYKEMSEEAGFTRFHEREKIDFDFKNNDWAQWASMDYYRRGSDDDVVAFNWEDNYREHDKLGYAITGMIGTVEEGGSFGRVIEDIVYHFGSARESIGVFDRMPVKYQAFYKRIENGFTDELLQEMLSQVKPNNHNRYFWDGHIKKMIESPEQLNIIIEALKKAG